MSFKAKVKEKMQSFIKDDSGAQVSTEVIILLAVGAGIAVALGIFARNRMANMEQQVDSQLQGFDDFATTGAGGE